MPFFNFLKKKDTRLCALHIDDSRWIRIPVSVLLRRQFGMRVIEAESGPEGILLAENNQPDLIILDVIMPQMDGFSTLAKLKENEKTKHIPVIMCTARDGTTAVNMSIRLGAVGYLTKPIDEDALLHRIREVLVSVGRWGSVTIADKFALDASRASEAERLVPSQPAEPVAPPPPAASTPVPARPCPRCRGPLQFIQQYDAWYCYTCRKYPDIETA